jgi:hypothetical protein
MPEKKTVKRAQRAKRQGKSSGTQAGEYVREEMHHIRRGEHGAKSTKQAIAIGLNKARRSGVKLKPPAKGKTSEKTRKSASQAYEKGQAHKPVSKRRSRASKRALKHEDRTAASHAALSRHAKTAARKRSAASRSRSAKKAARTRAR